MILNYKQTTGVQPFLETQGEMRDISKQIEG